MPFPRVPDQHKPGKPMVPSGYGIFYAVGSVCYWYFLAFLGVQQNDSLAMATSVLFGSTMGLFDDMADLRWRYKAILPLFAALPFMAMKSSDRTTIALFFLGTVDLNALFFILLVPAVVTVTTNTVNQLGGLNGLEALSSLIVFAGLFIASGNTVLACVPMLILTVLAYLSYTGKAFIGNVGSFSVGLTLAMYSVLMNLKQVLLISLGPFMLNSVLILLSAFFLKERATTKIYDDGRLYSDRVRSLRTLILHFRPMREHQAVWTLCLLVLLSTMAALAVHWLF